MVVYQACRSEKIGSFDLRFHELFLQNNERQDGSVKHDVVRPWEDCWLMSLAKNMKHIISSLMLE